MSSSFDAKSGHERPSRGRRFSSLRRAVDKAVAVTLVTLMTLLVACVLWQVATRFVIGRPSSFTEELARFLLIWLGLLGAARALGEGQHLALGLFSSTDSASRRRIRYLPPIASATFSILVLLIGGGQLSRLTWELSQDSAALGIPLSVVYAVVPLAGLIMLFYSVAALLEPASPKTSEPGLALDDHSAGSATDSTQPPGD